jgi:hypothetical protein
MLSCWFLQGTPSKGRRCGKSGRGGKCGRKKPPPAIWEREVEYGREEREYGEKGQEEGREGAGVGVLKYLKEILYVSIVSLILSVVTPGKSQLNSLNAFRTSPVRTDECLQTVFQLAQYEVTQESNVVLSALCRRISEFLHHCRIARRRRQK